MAQCSKCGSPLSDAQKFCGICGTPVVTETAPSEMGATVTAAETAVMATAAGTETAVAAAVDAIPEVPVPSMTPPPVTPPPVAVPPAVPPAPASAPPGFAPPAYPPQTYAAPGAAPGYPPPPGYAPQAAYGPGAGYPAGAYQPPRKINKALWIGIASAVVLVAVACILVFVVFWDRISGDGGGSEAGAQQALMASWADTQAVNETSGTFQATIDIQANTGQMSAEEQQMAEAFLGQPMTAAGTFAFTGSPNALDLTVAANLLGQKMDVGLRVLDGQPYVLFGGQWYEGPPDLQQQAADSGVNLQVSAIRDLLNKLSIDPTTWLTDLTKAGQEDINGVKAVHYSGKPDMVKMMTDMSQLMQSPEAQNLFNLGGSVSEDTGIDIEVPTEQELADLQAQLDAMLKDAKIGLWLAKDDNSMRKLSIDVTIVPPAEDAGGDSALAGIGEMLESIGLSATLTMAGRDEQVNIAAPDSPLPFTDLENALESGSGILGGLLGGGLGF